MSDIHIGDRVRVKPEYAAGFVQPWHKRFKKGLTGTVVSANNWGNTVEWDMPKRAKYPSDWTMRGIADRELEVVPAEREPEASQ